MTTVVVVTTTTPEVTRTSGFVHSVFECQIERFLHFGVFPIKCRAIFNFTTENIVFSMQYTANIVFFLTLIAQTCFASLTIKTFKLDDSLVEASIEILESCYADRFSTVGFAGPSAGSIIKSMSARETVIATTLLDGTSSVANNFSLCGLRDKLQAFVVTVTDPNALVEILSQVKKSKWWNHMASFFLIDLAEAKNGCSNAYELLLEAWRMNLINSKFMCFHRTKGRLIYTFNPYASKAPDPWQKENTYTGINGHVWTLFVRQYHTDKSRCDELDFAKTVDLGGYPIAAAVFDDTMNGDRHPWAFYRIEDFTYQLLVDSLNATWVIRRYPEGGLGSWISLLSIANATQDIEFYIKPIGYYPPCMCTYPFFKKEMRVITRYPGHKSQLDKFISVLDKPSRFGVLAVLMITLLFFKFLLKMPSISAILNLVLVICNAALPNIPQRTVPRIYLASLFIFVVTIQGIYSGKLSSLLTKNVRQPNIDSFEDLARSDHMIHMVEDDPFFYASPFIKRFDYGLPEWRRNEDSNVKSAGIGDERLLIDHAVRYKLHLSREPLSFRFAGYLIREDWPLEERVNAVYGRLAASGILDLLYARELRSQMKILESYERQDSEPELKVLTLQHLGFAFKILAIGLGFATMVFIVEVATRDWQ